MPQGYLGLDEAAGLFKVPQNPQAPFGFRWFPRTYASGFRRMPQGYFGLDEAAGAHGLFKVPQNPQVPLEVALSFSAI